MATDLSAADDVARRQVHHAVEIATKRRDDSQTDALIGARNLKKKQVMAWISAATGRILPHPRPTVRFIFITVRNRLVERVFFSFETEYPSTRENFGLVWDIQGHNEQLLSVVTEFRGQFFFSDWSPQSSGSDSPQPREGRPLHLLVSSDVGSFFFLFFFWFRSS